MIAFTTGPFDDPVRPGGFLSPSTMSTSMGHPHSPSPSPSASSSPSATPAQSRSTTALALGISLAVVGSLVLGGLVFYFVRRHLRSKRAQERAAEISSHRRTYMVSVDPSHLAARVTPFGIGVNAPDVEVPKFGEWSLSICCISPNPSTHPSATSSNLRSMCPHCVTSVPPRCRIPPSCPACG